MVKTTPKPRATKKSKGDEFGLFLSLLLPFPVALPAWPFETVLLGEALEEVTDGARVGLEENDPKVAVGLGVETADRSVLAALETACLASSCTPAAI